MQDVIRVGAEQARARFNRSLNDTRTNSRLTPEGRRERMAIAYTEVRSELDSLKERHTRSYSDRRNRLEDRLFGLSPKNRTATDILAMRDAEDRVTAIGDEQRLSELMTSALRNSDTTLISACLRRAWDLGSNRVVNQYADARPNEVPLLEEYIDVRNSDPDDGLPGPEEFLLEVQRPEELSRYSDLDVENIAAGADIPMRETNPHSRLGEYPRDAHGQQVVPL